MFATYIRKYLVTHGTVLCYRRSQQSAFKHTAIAIEWRTDLQNRQRDEVTRDVLQTAMGPGAGISRIMFSACLSHSQATVYLSHMMEVGLVVNDVERGKRYYRTTPKGVEYLAALNSMCELLQMDTRTSQI